MHSVQSPKMNVRTPRPFVVTVLNGHLSGQTYVKLYGIVYHTMCT